MYNFSFDPAFQRYVIASFIEKDMATGADYLRKWYFEDEATGDVAEAVRAFYLENKEVPGRKALLHELKRKEEGKIKFPQYLEIVEEIYKKVGDNGQYYRTKAIEFVRRKDFNRAIYEAYKMNLYGEDIEKALEKISEFTKKRMANGEASHDFLEGIESRAKNYFDSSRGESGEGRISTGFHLIDERIKGGLGSGETGVIIAPPKHGKTTALISFATHALLEKKKVLYVTLELSHKVISSKFDTNLFGRTLDEIKRKPKSFRERLKEMREEIRGGALYIAEYPTKGLSLYKLQDLIERVRPDVVFLDYAAIMRSARAKDERRFELTDIHEGLRGVAGHCKVPIWTAHQANRPSLARREIGMENVAEDFNIVAICDVSLSVNQSEDEKRSGTLRMHVMGNRLGSSGDSIECNVNWALSKITPAHSEEREI